MKLPRLEDLDRSTFATLVLALLAAAAWLSARGLEAHVDLRGRLAAAHAQQEALSPLAYRKPLPTLSALLGSRGRWAAVVRVDGVAGDDAARACDLPRDGTVRLVALAGDVPACLPSASVARVMEGTIEMIGEEMRTARWVIVDDAGRARYSRRALPTADELTRTLATFDTGPTAGRLASKDVGDPGAGSADDASRALRAGDAGRAGETSRGVRMGDARRTGTEIDSAGTEHSKRRVRSVRPAPRPVA